MTDVYFPESGKITLKQLVYVTCQTAAKSRAEYISHIRPWTMKSMWRLIFPNLSAPVFVVGASRSGTTFLGHCLGQLSEFSYHLEPVASVAMNPPLSCKAWSNFYSRFFIRGYVKWLMRIHGDADLRYIEKNPMNCLAVNFLVDAFPDARILHLVRDGRAVALSMANRWGDVRPDYFIPPSKRDYFNNLPEVQAAGIAWQQMVGAAQKAGMALASEQYCEVRYEDLVLKPDVTASKVLKFLEVKDLSSASKFRAGVMAAHTDAVSAWVDIIQDDDREFIEQDARSLLSHFNYME